ncbi:MAG TPA: serine/threonine-protein kinase [Gemmatimonadales bacterium]|nr:serine/threonine-protein kinase [Gemmatimonadales bacterium]
MRTSDAADAVRDRLQLALGEGFALKGRLGQGGFAVVYEAADERLKRRLAVKVLRAELDDVPGARERFRREAEAVAALRHPNIIPIYSVGEAQGLAFFVMPLIEGGSLADRLAREPRQPAEAARRILSEAAAGLAVAHRAGIVHRDIKPDNILLDGPDARVVLTDFGIAKALAADVGRLTQTGAVLGTPHYMSPEQASGEGAIDHRSDIYSLGIVGYQMLVGEVPFNAATVAAILVRHLTQAPPPLLTRRPDCPPDLAGAVMRCLAKTPEERFTAAEDLVRALDAAGGSAPTRAVRRASGVAALAALAPLRRFRIAVGAGLALIATLVLVDLLMHRVLLGPLSVIVVASVVAAEYGRLWMAGFTWRDVLARATPTVARVASPLPLDSAELGPHGGSIQQARNDRGAMLAVIQKLPTVERKQLGEVLPTVDALLARAADDARRLYSLERQLEPGAEEIARRLSDTRSEAPSPGRDQRIAVLERRLQAMGEMTERRGRLSAELSNRLAAVSRIRFELERTVSTGLGDWDSSAGVAAALEQARVLALTREESASPPDGAGTPHRRR